MSVPYRDFVYVDMDRVQSIIAQLRKGLLTELLENREKGATAKASAALKYFLSVTAEAQASAKRNVQRTTVLHDYAYQEALDALNEERLLLSGLEDLERDQWVIPDTAFVLVRGLVKLRDYAKVRSTVEHLPALMVAFPSEQSASAPSAPNRQQRRSSGKKGVTSKSYEGSDQLEGIKTLIDSFGLQDALSITVETSAGVKFTGRLNREYLREEADALIFKYGEHPTGEWTMLAQVGRVPQGPSSIDDRSQEIDTIAASVDGLAIQSGVDMLDLLSEVMGQFYALVGSAVYPSISVSPIAVYRESSPVT